MQLSDYAQALGAAQQLVPNWRQGDMQEAQLATARMQPQLIQAQIAESQAQQQRLAEKAAYDQQQRDSFQADLTALGAKPSPAKLYALSARHPEFANQIQGAAKGIGAEDAQKIVRNLAPVQSLIQNGKYDLAANEVKRHIDADKAAGAEPDENDVELYDMLTSGDPTKAKAAGGMVYGLLAALNPDTAAKNLADAGAVGGRKGQVVGRSIGHYDESGNWVVDYRDPESAEYRSVKNADGSESIVQVSGGGDPTSSGGAAGVRGDVSRLINTDAGGGYVPESVKTLGQFVNYGKAMNNRGAKSSSAGTYQINGTTMAEFAPKVLGSDWKTAPFNAESQEKVGEAIFNWAKQQQNPAKALRGRWVSLDAGEASRLVQGDWQQARGVIAQGETGGAPKSSAAAAGGGRGVPVGGAKVIFTSQPGAANPVDQATVNFYADKIAAGGDLPELGSGKESSAWRRAILSRAAEIQNGRGVSGGESNLAQADVKANRSALLQAQKQYTSTVGFEDTFQRNVKEVLRLAPQGVGGSAPIFNRWIQSGRKNVKGDPAVSAFNVAVNTAANEYAKLASGASGGAVTSDSARHEAMEILNNAQTLPQLKASIRQMQIDGHNRVVALDTQIKRLRDGISGAGGANRGQQAQPAKTPQGGRLIGTYQGRQVFQLPNGRRVVAK